MTNKEKFKEVFGHEMDDSSDCGFFDCSDRDTCDGCVVKNAKDYWNSEYIPPQSGTWVTMSYDVYIELLSKTVKEHISTTKNNLGVDCISRDAVLKPYEGLKDEDTISVWLIRKNIEQQPFVKQEPKIGHWIDTDEWRETVDGFEQWGYFRKCSKCGYVFKFLEIDNYCPNCGADMREVKE